MLNSRITAVLGPTNTGKTHYAIERMLSHRSGVIGLPLRLLAREVYDRIVAIKGPSVVAMITGEERIVPPRAAYWVCTVEAMPEGMGCDFLAVDEVQLCADAERGHVFTDRLLHARGLHETLFMGADTMRSAIAEMVPGVQFMQRDRFSELTYTGSKKISRMPARTAIVPVFMAPRWAAASMPRAIPELMTYPAWPSLSAKEDAILRPTTEAFLAPTIAKLLFSRRCTCPSAIITGGKRKFGHAPSNMAPPITAQGARQRLRRDARQRVNHATGRPRPDRGS